MKLRCVIVDDDESVSRTSRGQSLERDGVTVAGVAHSLRRGGRARRGTAAGLSLLIDIRLGAESGFRRGQASWPASGHATRLDHDLHARQGADYADLIAESPAAGFVAKADLSAAAIHRILGAD